MPLLILALIFLIGFFCGYFLGGLLGGFGMLMAAVIAVGIGTDQMGQNVVLAAAYVGAFVVAAGIAGFCLGLGQRASKQRKRKSEARIVS
ncbi:MAG TPA: hypothetical protein VFT05_18270 [Burkholderiaceae bacterium]|nr:hypothetical protein [Burkholderiaceae bacterium]